AVGPPHRKSDNGRAASARPVSVAELEPDREAVALNEIARKSAAIPFEGAPDSGRSQCPGSHSIHASARLRDSRHFQSKAPFAAAGRASPCPAQNRYSG